MAKYRYVHTSFWEDSFVVQLSPEDKYFYLYILTNTKTTQCGIYELPKKIIQFETGYNIETIDKLLKRFKQYDKIIYSEKTQEIAILNWPKYNYTISQTIIKRINKELKQVRDNQLVEAVMRNLPKEIGWGYDTLSIPYIYPIDTDTIIRKKKEEVYKKESNEENRNNTPYAEQDFSADSEELLNIRELFNKNCTSLKPVMPVTNWSSKRKKTVSNRWRDHPDYQFWIDFFKRVNASEFLTGKVESKNGPPFVADFDWIMQKDRFVQILEGKFDNREVQDDVDRILDQVVRGSGY
ncbi:MAG: replication protein [Petrotogales bacterium]